MGQKFFKVRFELKGAFEEEAPWGHPTIASPFRMRTGTYAEVDQRHRRRVLCR